MRVVWLVATVDEIKLFEVLREQELIVSVFTCLRFESSQSVSPMSFACCAAELTAT